MSEKFNPNNSSEEFQNESSENIPSMSRREFLSKAGKIGAGALAALWMPWDEKRAWAEEIKGGESWEEGVEKLRHEALHGVDEVQSFYVVDSNDEGVWRGFKMGVSGNVKTSADKINEELARKPKSIEIAHTHRLEVFRKFGLENEQIEEIRQTGEGDEEVIFPSMPPSILDIMHTISFQFQTQDGPTELSEMVVDPRGVWKYHADINHDFSKKLMYERHIHKRGFRFLRNNSLVWKIFSEQEEFKRFTRKFIKELWRRKEDFGDNEQEVIMVMFDATKDFEDTFQDILKETHEMAKEYSTKSVTDGNMDNEELIAQYAKFGITLTFKSHKEIQADKK